MKPFGRFSFRKTVIVCLSLPIGFSLWLLSTYSMQTYLHPRKNYFFSTDYADIHVNQTCVHPVLNPFDPDILKGFEHMEPISCSKTPNYVSVRDGYVFINADALTKVTDLKCQVRFINRKSDFENELESPIELNTNNSRLKLKKDFLKVECYSKSSKVYDNVHCGVAQQTITEPEKGAFSGRADVNILMIGFDSLSQSSYRRLLPKTVQYFTEKLDGQVLNGYNIVGDGTPQALIPILTGKTELELPRVLRRNKGSPYVDVFPMIWKDFKKAGYVTAFAEDSPHIGTFTYRMNGFKDQPTDHYMRPFHITAKSEFHKHKDYCLGSKRRSKIFLDWLVTILKAYPGKRKFIFGFHSELSHDNNNPTQTADEDILQTLEYLQSTGILNNTVLILMSDHGARFSKVRASLQGKQEERRPFFGVYFPKNIRTLYNQAWQNLKLNTNRLSTPFDIYATFRHLLKFERFEKASTTNRGLSLFNEIPQERSCDQAAIEPHWCACLQWSKGDIHSQIAKNDAIAVVEHINNLTSSERDVCVKLNLKEITKFQTLNPSKRMLQFKRTKDLDGYEPDLTDNTNILSTLHQLEIKTEPNDAVYEITLNTNYQKNVIRINTGDISRLNKYGNTSHCIVDEHENLRKFCFCKDMLKSFNSSKIL